MANEFAEVLDEISLEEMQQDLAYTDTDIMNLKLIIMGLNGFLNQNGGENRSMTRIDVFKYKGHLATANKLRVRIQERISKLTA